MIRQRVTWLGAIVVCLALNAPVRAQDDEPATEDAPMPAAIAPRASSLPVAVTCSSACPTSASSIDDRNHSDTGWLIIGIGGSVAATSLALGASMMAQASTNAESRLGSASLAAGITGIAVSLVIGLIAM